MGAAIGYELVRRGAGAVTILEKSALGAGSTGKSGANIRCHYSHPLTTSMALYGLRAFETFADDIGGPPVFTRAGLLITAPESMRQHLESVIKLQRDLGVKVSHVSREEFREENCVSEQCEANVDRDADVQRRLSQLFFLYHQHR